MTSLYIFPYIINVSIPSWTLSPVI